MLQGCYSNERIRYENELESKDDYQIVQTYHCNDSGSLKAIFDESEVRN